MVPRARLVLRRRIRREIASLANCARFRACDPPRKGATVRRACSLEFLDFPPSVNERVSRGDVEVAPHPSAGLGLPCWTRPRVAGKGIYATRERIPCSRVPAPLRSLLSSLFATYSLSLPFCLALCLSYHRVVSSYLSPSFSLGRVARAGQRDARRTTAIYNTKERDAFSARPIGRTPVSRGGNSFEKRSRRPGHIFVRSGEFVVPPARCRRRQ